MILKPHKVIKSAIDRITKVGVNLLIESVLTHHS